MLRPYIQYFRKKYKPLLKSNTNSRFLKSVIILKSFILEDFWPKDIHMKVRSGFTLVEMAIVLVVIGLLAGMGASLLGILMKQNKFRENQRRLKINAEILVQYALEHGGKLPKTKKCLEELRYPKDAYGQFFLCKIAPELENKNACSVKATSLYIKDLEQGLSKSRPAAFILISGGRNHNIQTRPTSPVIIYPFEHQGVDDYTGDFKRLEPYDDQVEYYLLLQLKAKINCPPRIRPFPNRR